MNKKLLAVAVAGALAAPGLAFAQASSVTISGIFKMGFANYKMDSSVPGRINNSQTMVVDNSSRIIFNVNESLGNGTEAFGQVDFRFQPDNNQALGASGNTFVGLKNAKWGGFSLGRHDLHYGRLSDELASKAGALQAAAIGLMDYMPTAAGVNTAIANGTRTPNVLRYDTPNWNGFNMIVAYSTEPIAGTERDMAVMPAGSSTRKGDGWNVNPTYTNGPFKIGYSYWQAKPDAPTAASLDQRGDTVYGGYAWGGFRVGLGWNRSKLENSVGGGTNAERDSWSLPMLYTWGPHTVVGHYTVADDIDSSVVKATGYGNTGAKMFAIAYNYDLSKRTSVALTYAKINNESGATYAFFTGTGALGSPDMIPGAGESPEMIQASIRHAF